LKKVCAWCLPIGLAINIYTTTVFAVVPRGRVSLWAWSAGSLWLLGSHILSAGYVSGLALIFLNQESRRWLTPFAAVGRMALTNYLMQSVLCTLFFYHYTTGMYGKIGPAWGLVPTVILYAAQVVFSNWWLQRYRFGPMEWLWRGMTYGKFPTMHMDELVPVVESPVPALAPSPIVAAITAAEPSKPDEVA
jgi:uncharacterized protein